MFKNWKEICKIKDFHFMTAMALLDLKTTFGLWIAGRLPEYFSSEQQAGPIPLSVIKLRARENTQRKVGEPYDDYPVTYEALDGFDIPLIEFWWEKGYEPLPEELGKLMKEMKQGDTVEWKGKKITLLEDNPDCGVYFAPAECIASDK